MKLTMVVLFGLLMCFATLLSQQSLTKEDQEAITACAMDYADGFLSANAARMERAVHPELSKVNPQIVQKTGRMMVGKMGASYLVGITGIVQPVEEAKRNITVTILDCMGDLASVKVTTNGFWDYLHLARIDGQWKIVNVLWITPPAAPKEKLVETESNALIACASDYAEGRYEGNAERVRKAVYPELNKALPMKHPRAVKQMLIKTTASQLVEMAAAKLALLEKDKRNLQVTVLDVMEHIASVKLTSARYDDYLHLVKIDGEWKIINALWMQPQPAK